MRPMHVLHVLPSLATADGGPTTALVNMERHLRDAGLRVTTITTVDGRAAASEVEAEEVEGVRRIRVQRLTSTYKVAPGLLPALGAALRHCDVVHIHSLFSFAPTAAAWSAHLAGVPYIVRPLGTLASYGLRMRRPRLKRLSVRCIEGPILRRAAAVHFTSEAERDEARQHGLGGRGIVIPLGVDGIMALPDPPPAHDGRCVVLFLSRLDPKKNLEALIDAFAASPALAASARLLIAGGGQPGYVATLQARVARAGLADRVAWLGHVDGAAKRAAFAAADVFAMPSFSENFGIAAVEALSIGLPCVLGRGVAVAGEVEAGGAGIAVSPDAQAIRLALETLVASPDRRHAMAARARVLAEEFYSPTTMARRLISLYEEVAGSRV